MEHTSNKSAEAAKRGTVNESTTAPSIAARSGISIGSDVWKNLPDPLKLTKDIRDQLRATDLNYSLKHQIVSKTKEVETLINCYKVLSPYFRKVLVNLRQAIKKKMRSTEEKMEQVSEQFQLFVEYTEKIKAKKYQIIEAAEAKKVAVDRKRKLFQVLIEDNIRICSTDSIVDLSTKMNEANKFKRLVKEIEKIGSTRNFPQDIKEDLSEMCLQLYNTLALDGLTALKVRHDVVVLRNAVVKGPDAEDEVKQRLKNMKSNVASITNQCESRRDTSENYVNDCTKMMLDMDGVINEKAAMLRAQKTGKDQKK